MTENLFIGYINLDKRVDRKLHMENQLKKIGLEATRFRGMLPHEYKGDPKKIQTMMNRTPGAVGCHYSQVTVMERALQFGMNAMVLEDDVVFCDDFIKRLNYIDNFCATHQWDIIWLGGTVHINPPHWHTGKNPDLRCEGLGRDAETTDDARMLRTYGAFSTYAYIVNKDSIEKVLSMLDSIVHESMGIDWAMIKMQPQLFTYMFIPGCTRQMDNPSDIGKPGRNGKQPMTIFSGFARLNGNEAKSKYWYQNKMENFDPTTFNFAEAKK